MEVNDKAQSLDMPNGLSKEINYPQKFVRAADPNRAGPRNHEAMLCPSFAEVMKEVHGE